MRLWHKCKRLSSFQVILLGFAAVILIGSLLLMLPIASRSRRMTPFSDALFTATSAVCVTGLVVQDTASYWSGFGQAVILLMIQIGGMGVVTVAASFAMLAGKKIGLGQRSTMQEAISAPSVGGIVRMTGFVVKGTFLIELIGALLMMPVFCMDYGPRGIWMAVFHSVSAFCNAGFDLMGTDANRFASLTGYAVQPVINLVIMLLIVIGGIGFLTWEDIYRHKWHLKRYRTQSKVILIVSALLIFLPALYFFFFEFQDRSVGERVWLSLFQSVTQRTAGFNTAELTAVTQVGVLLMIGLMLVGGSPGSTAGGMKTTTLAVLFSSALSVFCKQENAQLCKRRIADETVKSAAAILVMYLVLFLGGGAVICCIEGLPLLTCLYETASAVGTVGLTLGITPGLGTASRIILMALMYLGRVGGLTLIYATLGDKQETASRLPLDKITVG